MVYAKDCLAFTYIHRDSGSGEVAFMSRSASQYCPLPAESSFHFDRLVAATASQDLQKLKETTSSLAPQIHKYSLFFNGLQDQDWQGTVYEIAVKGGFQGVVFKSVCEGMDYLAGILLEKGTMTRDCLRATVSASKASEVAQVTAKLVDIFEKNYIHFPKHDEWFTSDGKSKFANQVRYHVERGIALELILPAFPVKSCNPNKVIGKLPDKGEELAIHSMKIVSDLVKAVYPPGVHFNVVSDGHVFSDLVASDDATVDTYGHIFRKMASELYPGLITFYRLDDFLFSDESNMEEMYKLIQGTSVSHPVKTVLTEGAETARRIMLFLFGSDDSDVKMDIKNDPETATLYRGFSRFMFEDLAQHESCAGLASKNAKKKVCEKVGFFMIQRNRAYSSLVEWLFPLQLRISIHPHPNRGPKYGINIIHSSLVAMQRLSSESIFHIPTPWHNAVLELEDGKFMLLHSGTIRGRGNFTKELEVNDELVRREGYEVVLVRYPDGRPSHLRQISLQLCSPRAAL